MTTTRHTLTKEGTGTTRGVCALCFLLFTVAWLYGFQADMLAVAQHVLSGGVTHYDRTVGTIVITILLMLLQQGVYYAVRLSRRTHALTYFPSFLLLTFLSDVNIDTDNSVEVGRSWWMLLILLVLWTGAVWMARQMLPFGDRAKQPTGFAAARTWMNVAQMTAMMLMVAAVANTNAVQHFRAHAETALMRGDCQEAMQTGWESLETDPQLTMLRAYALSRQGMLGEKLFQYPVAGEADDLLPMRIQPLLMPADSIWKHLGAKPAIPMKASAYYGLLLHDSLATPAVADYVLCGKLIDRDLNAFVRLLPRFYDCGTGKEPADSMTAGKPHPTLPRHYREALLLHDVLTANKQSRTHDEQTQREWQQMAQLLGLQATPGAKATDLTATLADSKHQLLLLENFRRTYWYYFFSPAQSKP